MTSYRTFTWDAYIVRPTEEYRKKGYGYRETFTGNEDLGHKVFIGGLSAHKYIECLCGGGDKLSVFGGTIFDGGLKTDKNGDLYVGVYGEYDYVGDFVLRGEVRKFGNRAECSVDREFLTECKNGCLTYVEDLVKQGANPNGRGDYALQVASKYGHLEVVKYLVEECGCDVNKNLPAKEALYLGHLHVVKYLVSKGASLGGNFSVSLLRGLDDDSIYYLYDNGYIDEDKRDSVFETKECINNA